MSYNTIVFSEKWFEVARRVLKDDQAKLQYLEAVLNYALMGATPPKDRFSEDARKAFEDSKYEIELLNPKVSSFGAAWGSYARFSLFLKPEEIFNPEDFE